MEAKRKKGGMSILRESASHLLRLTPEELSRAMYPRVQFLDDRLRSVNVEDDSGEPWLPLAWSSLQEIMGRLEAKHVMVVDAGRSLHLLRSGVVVTLEELRGVKKKEEEETVVDVHVRRRRTTSTRDPLLYRGGGGGGVGKSEYTEVIKKEICLDDGGGDERGTYRTFCERLKVETSQYLKTTSQ
jgi:hypothetical protein